MQTNPTHAATLNDMIFEGRNKAYGAYVLRQVYDRHLGQATLYAVGLFLLLFSLPVVANLLFKKDVAVTMANIDREHKLVEVILPKVQPLEVVKPKQPSAMPPKAPAVKNTSIQVVDDSTPVRDEIPTQNQLMTANSGTVTSEGDGTTSLNSLDPESGSGEGVGSGTGPAMASAAPKIFLSVENMPQFEGGLSKLMEFVGKNLRYPRAAQSNGVEGTVVVSFVVASTGDVTDVKVLKGLGYGTEEEAIRVMKKLPRWKPGNQNGRAVPVQMTLPIRLELK